MCILTLNFLNTKQIGIYLVFSGYLMQLQQLHITQLTHAVKRNEPVGARHIATNYSSLKVSSSTKNMKITSCENNWLFSDLIRREFNYVYFIDLYYHILVQEIEDSSPAGLLAQIHAYKDNYFNVHLLVSLGSSFALHNIHLISY